MAVYVVTGKLGNGKTLVTVGRIRDAIQSGRRIATNLDLNLKGMFHHKKKGCEVIRIPDKPTIDDLNAIGTGYDGPYDESKFGVLVLDECGTWFNSRNWQDKSRADVNDWFLHARKLRWHVYLIIQDIKLLDSQARDALAEFLVFCRRLDNLRVPLIGGLIKTVTGYNIRLPRMHRAKVTYSDADLVSDVWWYRGDDLFSAYQTDQCFLANYPHGVHCLLTPWHLYGRFSVPMNRENVMRITKIYWRRFRSPVALAAGLLFGAFAGFLRFAPAHAPAEPVSSHQVSSVSSHTPAIVQRLGSMSIRGTMTVNGTYRYQFTVPGHPGYYTDADLSQVGVTLAKRGPCRVDAYYDGHQVPIYCM